MVKSLAQAKSLASAWNFTDFSQTIAVSISAYRRPIKKPKKHKWSLSLSTISFHTHDLLIRGLPRESPLQPQTVQRGVGMGGGAPPCASSPDNHSRGQVKWPAGWGRGGGGGGGGLCTTDKSTQQPIFLFLCLSPCPIPCFSFCCVSGRGSIKNSHRMRRTILVSYRATINVPVL